MSVSTEGFTKKKLALVHKYSPILKLHFRIFQLAKLVHQEIEFNIMKSSCIWVYNNGWKAKTVRVFSCCEGILMSLRLSNSCKDFGSIAYDNPPTD